MVTSLYFLTVTVFITFLVLSTVENLIAYKNKKVKNKRRPFTFMKLPRLRKSMR
ncbi:hypothetical protein HNQ94_000370 [Salirhabdus euzebyi]|uniref:Uncharacterized protein n=1 Tax=Salirhabdus euzebyi TaxID=394506 RepID=A0A841PT00_9BACI|nr:hypothetical protein [Salirhabdus euzebyi]MBB6451949.1 hypothetical protein [Salirhabdus euzebyi]